tara:strand:- start:7664 stop:8560 length:897 start_codon:yes stop_codon:yes gene_type:complete
VIKALVIGLGNIGAQYDYNSDEVLTHVKAISLRNDIDLSVFDVNLELTNNIVNKYKCSSFIKYTAIDFSLFDLVSICVPTTLHSQILKDCLKANVPVILCEKPIAQAIPELDELKLYYEKSKSKVLVNYFRRFHPNYKSLRDLIKKENNKNLKIVVRYCKGWMNNASHALDIIQYLLNTELELNNVTEYNRFLDFLPLDPSISLEIRGRVNINCEAKKSLNPLWEVEFYFENLIIKLVCGGQIIELYKEGKLVCAKKNQLRNYMVDVLIEALNLKTKKNKADNFIESLELNKKMLLVI